MNKLSNDDLDNIIAVLMTELKAWRAEYSSDDNAPEAWRARIKACMAASEATLAKHNKRL